MKKKNILKMLGVGVLALTGTFAFAGCSDINLTEKQIDKILYVVDESDTFMQDVLDLMEKSTNKLNKEEAYDLYKLSILKLSTNQDGILNNLKISASESREGTQNYRYEGLNYLYQMTDGTKIDLNIRGDRDSFEIKYSTEQNTFVDFNKNGESINKTEKNEVLLLNRNENGFYAYSIFELNKDDVAGSETLENGNVKIYYTKTVLSSDEHNNYSTYMTGYAIMSKDCLLLEENFCIHWISEGEDNSEFVSEDIIKYSYGIIKDADIEGYLNEALSYENEE